MSYAFPRALSFLKGRLVYKMDGASYPWGRVAGANGSFIRERERKRERERLQSELVGLLLYIIVI